MLDPLFQQRRPRRQTRSRLLAWAMRAVVLAAIFVVGIALGEALQDNPRPGGSRTRIQTVKPVPVGRARETVTVTVRAP